MRVRVLKSLFVSSLCVLLCSACLEKDEELTREEAQEALESEKLASSAQALTLEVIEVSTKFTIGGAVKNAAKELRDLLISQAGCTKIGVRRNVVVQEGATVTLDFGTLDDKCMFNGHTYAGIAKLTVMRTDAKELEVYHEWEGLTDGQVTVDGWARVTWNGNDRTRHVEHDVDWTSKKRKGTMHTSGDRTQRLVDPALGLKGGIVIDGTRDWSLDDGRAWHLDIDGIEVRGQDPVPQAGTYTLTTPKDKTLTMEFERISDNKIRVTATGPKGRSVKIEVLSVR